MWNCGNRGARQGAKCAKKRKNTEFHATGGAVVERVGETREECPRGRGHCSLKGRSTDGVSGEKTKTKSEPEGAEGAEDPE